MKCISKQLLTLTCVIAASVFMQACVPVDTPVSKGNLVDSPVEGIQYFTQTQAGITGENGSFNYIPGETIQFAVGTILLPAVEANKTITPLDLAGTDLVNDQTALNIARFLQSVDFDQNPDNGITISEATREMATGVILDFTKSHLDFNEDSNLDNMLISLGFTLVEQAVAKKHFENTLSDLFTGETFNTVLDDGISVNEETLVRGLGYISDELTGECYQYTAWIYGVFPLLIDICYEGDGTGTVSVNQIQSDMVWSVDRESGVGIVVDGPLGGVSTLHLSRLEDGKPLLEVDRLPIDVLGLPSLISVNTLADFFLLNI